MKWRRRPQAFAPCEWLDALAPCECRRRPQVPADSICMWLSWSSWSIRKVAAIAYQQQQQHQPVAHFHLRLLSVPEHDISISNRFSMNANTRSRLRSEKVILSSLRSCICRLGKINAFPYRMTCMSEWLFDSMIVRLYDWGTVQEQRRQHKTDKLLCRRHSRQPNTVCVSCVVCLLIHRQ